MGRLPSGGLSKAGLGLGALISERHRSAGPRLWGRVTGDVIIAVENSLTWGLVRMLVVVWVDGDVSVVGW